MFKKKAVIFDMDGTLIDSERVFLDVATEYSKSIGLSNDEEIWHSLIGFDAKTSSKMLVDHFGDDYDVEYHANEMQKLRHEFYDNNPVPVKKGIYEIFDYLIKNDYKIAVASSTRHQRVVELLTAINIYDKCDFVIGGDRVDHCKPHPEVFNTVVENLNIAKDDCLIVEDSVNGILAANAAGIDVVHVPDIAQIPNSMYQDINLILNDLSELIKYLN